MSTRSSIYYQSGEHTKIHVYQEFVDDEYYIELTGHECQMTVKVTKEFAEALRGKDGR